MAAPAPWFRVGTTFAYLDGKFTSNPTFAGSTLAYDGNALPRAPKVKLTPYVEVEAPLAAGTVTARADYAFQDSYYSKDRKSVVEGKSVSASVVLGGTRIRTKTHNKRNSQKRPK